MTKWHDSPGRRRAGYICYSNSHLKLGRLLLIFLAAGMMLLLQYPVLILLSFLAIFESDGSLNVLEFPVSP